MQHIDTMMIVPDAITPELLKKWIIELTAYSPQQVDTAISHIVQEQANDKSQYN